MDSVQIIKQLVSFGESVSFNLVDVYCLCQGFLLHSWRRCIFLFSFSQAEKNRAAAMANNLQKGSAGPMRLYVGSLHFNITEDMLRGIFEPFGRVNFNLTCCVTVVYLKNLLQLQRTHSSGGNSTSHLQNICFFFLLFCACTSTRLQIHSQYWRKNGNLDL